MCKCKQEPTHVNVKINTIHLALDSIMNDLPTKLNRIEKLVDDLDGMSKHITEIHKRLSLQVKKTLEA